MVQKCQLLGDFFGATLHHQAGFGGCLGFRKGCPPTLPPPGPSTVEGGVGQNPPPHQQDAVQPPAQPQPEPISHLCNCQLSPPTAVVLPPFTARPSIPHYQPRLCHPSTSFEPHHHAPSATEPSPHPVVAAASVISMGSPPTTPVSIFSIS